MRRGSITYGSEELKQMNDELRKEMEEIRSCNQQELLNAWAWTEQLEDEKDDLLHENETLRNELVDARKREETLMKRLKIASKGVISSNRRRSFASGIHDMMEDVLQPSSKRSLLAMKEKIKKDFINQAQHHKQEKDELVAEWRSKVQCREIVLESLEKTTMIQGESITKLRMQLEHQEKESEQREASMKQELEELSRKVNEERKVVAKREKKMQRYHEYIEDLSSELQRLVNNKKGVAKKSFSTYSVMNTMTSITVKDAKPTAPPTA